jgi:peptidoglycan/xylan/chitin deacetylase (PgdA/CDA1 family)
MMIRRKVYEFVNNLPLRSKYYSGMVTIFMLHRVSVFEPNKLYPNENMKVTPLFLEKFILQLRENGYEFISLDRLYEILINDESVENNVIFTFDDGYADNYDIAYPILKKYNVPFTVYVTTSFIEKKAVLWWYILEDLIINNDKLVVSKGMVFNCSTQKEKIDSFFKLRKVILAFNDADFIGQFNRLFQNYKIDLYAKTIELTMTWEQIKSISEDPLCTIGGHTKNHYALNTLSRDVIHEEILAANKMIEKNIEKKIEHFAYPFGGRNEVGKREFEIVNDLKFKTTTTTRRGNIYKEHKGYLQCLPRIMLTEKFNIENMNQFRRKKIVTV